MTDAALDPITNAAAWDAVEVGGVEAPGICILSGWKRAHEWDQKKGKGGLGATITFVQRPPAKGSIEFLLWLPSHFVEWKEFRQQFKYDPTKQEPQAVDIYHPSLDDIGIHSVVCEDIGAIIHKGKGKYSITVALLEYFPPPPKSAVGTPTQSVMHQTLNDAKGVGVPVTAESLLADVEAQRAAILAESKRPT